MSNMNDISTDKVNYIQWMVIGIFSPDIQTDISNYIKEPLLKIINTLKRCLFWVVISNLTEPKL